MHTVFYIVLRIKKGSEFEPYGRFNLGNNRHHAKAIFKKLAGNKTVDDSDVLHLDFMEVINEVPVNLDILSCSLEQLCNNVSIITKEMFKLLNLREI